MKVWEVEVRGTMYVVADDEYGAEDAAREALNYHTDDCSVEVDATEIATDEAVDTDWRNAIPFGAADGDERTVVERLTE